MIQPTRLLAATTVAAVLASAPTAFGFAEIARGTLTANARLNFEYDSNVFANSTEVDDFSVIFTPSLAYTRNVGRISTAAQLGMRSIAFTDTSGQDSIDPFVNVNFTLDRAEKGSASLALGYARTTEANDILLTRTKSDEYRGTGRLDYFYSEKTGLRFSLGGRVSDFNTPGFNDVSSWNLGAGVLYRYSPKLVGNLSYSFSPEKATNLGGGLSDPSSKNHRVSIGLEGEVAPKLTGTVSVGIAYRDFDVGGSDNTLFVSTSLSWSAAEKTSFTLAASNDFDTTAGAESAERLFLSLGFRHALTEKLNLNGSVGFQRSQLDKTTGVSRTDEAYLASLGVAYRINDNLSASGGITHRINDSNLALADYDRTVVSAGVSLTF